MEIKLSINPLNGTVTATVTDTVGVLQYYWNDLPVSLINTQILGLGKHKLLVRDDVGSKMVEFMSYDLKGAGTYNQSYTMSYSFDTPNQGWISQHSILPNYLFSTYKGLFSIIDGNVYLNNYGGKGEYFGTVNPSWIEVALNETQPSFFQSISWRSVMEDDNGTPVYDKTFDKVLLRNPYQNSGELSVLSEDVLEQVDDFYSLKQHDQIFTFNKFQDRAKKNKKHTRSALDSFSVIVENLDMENVFRNFVGKYLIVRLETENFLNYTLKLQSIDLPKKPAIQPNIVQSDR